MEEARLQSVAFEFSNGRKLKSLRDAPILTAVLPRVPSDQSVTPIGIERKVPEG